MTLTIAAAGIATACSLGSMFGAFLCLARLRLPREAPAARVTLLLTVTGSLPHLEELLAALSGQTLRPDRLIVAAESQDDPAYARVAAAAEGFPELNIELVSAGLSELRSQKCTNVLAAAARLDARDANVVLLDAGISPQPWWLAALVAPLAAGEADVVNGYRWQMPAAGSPAAILIACIDRIIGVLPRPRRAGLLWAGSIAFTRSALQILDLPKTIGRELTDDLAIGTRAAKTGLRVSAPPFIRVPARRYGDFRAVWRYGRRQYQIVHLYRPRFWALAAALVSGDLISRIILVFGVFGAFVGGLESSGPACWTLVALGLFGSIASETRSRVSKKVGVADLPRFRLAQHLVAWTILPAAAFHASLIWGSLITSPVNWAHIRYTVDGSGRVRSVRRHAHGKQDRPRD